MRTLGAAIVASFVATAAVASGPTVYVDPPVVPPPVIPMAPAWAGPYIGVGVTYARATMETTGATLPDATGPGFSAIAGYNWQSGNVVFGAEVALDFSRREGTNDCGSPPDTCMQRIENHASIRGRLGYAMGRSLVYVLAGYATDERALTVDDGMVTTIANRFNGPVVGIGFERMITDSWNLRGDLEYYMFGDADFGGATVEADTTLVRFSLVRHF